MGDAVRKLTWDKPRKNKVIDHDILTDRRTGEVLRSKVDYTRWKDRF